MELKITDLTNTEERGKCIYSKGGAGERMDTCFFVEAVKPMKA